MSTVLPTTAFKAAFPPQHLEIHSVDLVGKQHIDVQLLHGAVTLGDYYCAQLAGRILEGASFSDMTDEGLDAIADELWRLVAAVLRRRPVEGPPAKDTNGRVIPGPGSGR